MAPFSLPAPCIIPLRLPVFGGHKSIDTNTKIQLLCETHLDHKIFYTLDGTKPQPYAGIVQGSKVIKYCTPICLPPGKITIKAVAVNANIHTMCSSVVTKRFDVLKVESENCDEQSAKAKKLKKSKVKKKHNSIEKERDSSDKIDVQDRDDTHRFDTNSVREEEHILDCFDEAFIGGSEFDAENSEIEDSIEDESSFPDDNNNNASDNNCNNILDKDEAHEESGDIRICDITFKTIEDPLSETVEETTALIETNREMPNTVLTTTSNSSDSQFCCLKCDLTLQQCISCNKMNAVSSKFCIGCGKQLSRICSVCKEFNPGVASFCQYCGKKLKSDSGNVEPHLQMKVDHSIMAKPASKNVAIQKLPITVDKYTQTVFGRSPIKKSHPSQKRVLDHSPGRGYWHQQLDYICNHLKSHAYNNVEFRKEISQPMLSDFKEAEISKGENSIKVTVVFSPLVVEKYGLQLPKETRPTDEACDA